MRIEAGYQGKALSSCFLQRSKSGCCIDLVPSHLFTYFEFHSKKIKEKRMGGGEDEWRRG